MKQVSNAIKSFVLSSPRYHSIPQRKAFSKYLFVLLLAGFAIISSSFQNENLLSSSQNFLKKEVPFKGKFTLSHTETGVILTGQGSHIGRFTLVSEGNATTITAANGDQIFGTRTVSGFQDLGNGMVQVDLDNTITGGTGRFAGATGSFVIYALINENIGTGEGTFDGTISY